MTINTEQFVSFLVKAKKSTYAGTGDDYSLPSPFSGSKMLAFEEGYLGYRDIYFGMTQFVGQEVVYLKDRAIWSMAYSGSSMQSEDTHGVYEFLRQALLLVSASEPFRGPREFIGNTDLIYRNSCNGDINFFSGEETIWRKETLLYQLNYTGGWIA